MKLTRIVGQRALAVAALTGLVACSADRVSSGAGSVTRAEHRTIAASGYKLPSSFDEAAGFPLNRLIFVGTVVEVSSDRRVSDTVVDGVTGDGVMKVEAVHTPVVVVVTKSYAGRLANGERVTVRAMGGTAEGLTYVTDAATDKRELQKGTKLLVFSDEMSQVVGEDAPAVTPNFVYKKHGNSYVDITYSEGSDDGKKRDSRSEAEVEARLKKG